MAEKKRGPIEPLKIKIENGQKLYIRYAEGADLYSMGLNTFRELAKASGAVRKMPGVVLINVKVLNDYIEVMYG